MLVTPSGIFIEVKLYAFWNALLPMLVTSLGIVIEVNVDAENARFPIVVKSDPEANVTAPKL